MSVIQIPFDEGEARLNWLGLVDALNDDGRIYLTQGMYQGRKMIRFSVGQFDCTRADVMMAGEVIAEIWQRLTADA